mmetsp:Transcript_100245/g.321469  ORF Transcript_100245/g.321469 Transcript_100245/m.321469 type:complete len:148 (-) Transcript_100245:722-1165(-)
MCTEVISPCTEACRPITKIKRRKKTTNLASDIRAAAMYGMPHASPAWAAQQASVGKPSPLRGGSGSGSQPTAQAHTAACKARTAQQFCSDESSNSSRSVPHSAQNRDAGMKSLLRHCVQGAEIISALGSSHLNIVRLKATTPEANLM